MRKFLALALSCILLVASLASCATGLGDPDAINDYTPEVDYLIDNEGNYFYFEEAPGDTAILVKYAGVKTEDDHVKIPDKDINGRSVAGIGESVFYNLAAVVEVEIPETVTSISPYAFANCTELTSITLPDGLLSIGFGAFNGCTKLETVKLGKSLVSIDDFAFRACPVLTNIELPATVESIGDGAFYECVGLTGFTAPEALKEIGALAFYNCTGMIGEKTIKLSSTLEKIGSYAFVTASTSMKSSIDTASYAESSKAAEYVNAMADTEVEDEDVPADTIAPEEETDEVIEPETEAATDAEVGTDAEATTDAEAATEA